MIKFFKCFLILDTLNALIEVLKIPLKQIKKKFQLSSLENGIF